MLVKHQPYYPFTAPGYQLLVKFVKGEVSVLTKHLPAGIWKSMKSDFSGFSAWIC